MKAYVQLEEICVWCDRKRENLNKEKTGKETLENVSGDHYWDFSLPVFDIPKLTNFAHVLNLQQLPNLMQSPLLLVFSISQHVSSDSLMLSLIGR